MTTYGCNSHYSNLVMGDIKTESVMKHVVQKQRAFKNVHSLHGKLKEKGGPQQAIPNQTRWNSSKD